MQISLSCEDKEEKMEEAPTLFFLRYDTHVICVSFLKTGMIGDQNDDHRPWKHGSWEQWPDSRSGFNYCCFVLGTEYPKIAKYPRCILLYLNSSLSDPTMMFSASVFSGSSSRLCKGSYIRKKKNKLSFSASSKFAKRFNNRPEI